MVAIAYLRPFDVDDCRLLRRVMFGPLRARKSSITDIVKTGCREHNIDLLAVADPQGSRGVGKVVIDENWEQHVRTALSSASGAIIVAGPTPGTAWEIRTLAATHLPILLLRNPALPRFEAGLVLAAAFEVMGGRPDHRDFARDALALVRPDNTGVDAISGPLDDGCVTHAVGAWLAATSHLAMTGWLRAAEPLERLPDANEEPMRNLLAVAAGLRRAIIALDERRDLAISIGEEGKMVLLAFSLVLACAAAAPTADLSTRLRDICEAHNRESVPRVEPDFIEATYLTPPTDETATLQSRFVSEVIWSPRNSPITEADNHQYFQYSTQVERVCTAWMSRLEAAGRRVWT